MTGTIRVPRSRGAISGLLLVLLGAWGALIPFIGPYADYAYTPDDAWHYTAGRLWLEILPGAGALLGGLLVLLSANRVTAILGAWVAAVSGAWFVLGIPLSTLWSGPTVGDPTGGSTRQTVEYVGFFGGLGVAIVFLAALALGRFAVVGVREADRARVLADERRARADESDTATGYGDRDDIDDHDTGADTGTDTGGHHFPWSRSRHMASH